MTERSEIVLDPAPGCKLCLSSRTALTREHIPSQSAGNRGRHQLEVLRFGDDGPTEFELPDGLALTVLCEACNTRYGSRLGTTFGDFVAQVQSSGRFISPRGGVFACAMDVYPSRVLRQLLLNFLCIQPDGDRNRWDFLRRFIRGRDPGLPEEAPHVALYVNISDTYRVVPVGVVGALRHREESWVGAEIAAPGLGVVFTLGDPATVNPVIAGKFLDVSDWADRAFSKREHVTLELPRHRVEVIHPLGFGRKSEVGKWQSQNHILWLASRFHSDVAPSVAGLLWRPDRRRRRHASQGAAV